MVLERECLKQNRTNKQKKKTLVIRQAWWCTPVIPALGRLRQEGHEFEVSQGYVVRPRLNKQKP
jgi:hypothetical protein